MSSDIQGVSDDLMQHYKTEELTLERILLLENQFREYYTFMKTELLVQKDLVTRLWLLSQRYVLLQTNLHCNIFPEIYTLPAEESIMDEFNEKLKALRRSNCVLCAEFRRLRQSCTAFNQLCDQLDMSVESPFILGDAYHKPLSFFIALIDDLLKYLHAWLLKLKFNTHLIDPAINKSLALYKTLIETSEDFEQYFNVGLTYCKLLRPKPVC